MGDRVRIGLLSGGCCSWAACKRDAQANGVEGLVLLHTDTRGEDESTYAFLRAGAENIGAPLTVIADGRTVWEVFRDEGMIGNTRVDLCSKILKRERLRRWLAVNCDPTNTVVRFGYTAHEAHRYLGGRGKPGVEARWLADG